MPESARERVQLAPGVALFATDRGLVARTPARWFRIDLGDRAYERDVIGLLRDAALLDDDPRAPRAIRALQQHALVVRSETEAALPERLDSSGPHVVVCGAPDDAELGARVRALIEGDVPFIVAWIDERGVAMARHEPSRRGCPLCAWHSDSALARYATDQGSLADAPRAYGGARALFARASARLAAPLESGHVWIHDAIRGEDRVEPIVATPSCGCATRGAAAQAPRADWSSLSRARYAAVWPMDTATSARAARVVFRRSRAPWKADASALGVALAAGDDAELRALAEAIERYCFLHAPPHRRHESGRQLGDTALDPVSVQSLLYRDEEYERIGFRFGRYDRDAPQDWCLARRIVDERGAYVPASVVGRAPQGSLQLVDATSNGYAAHLDRDLAVERALLEVIERDAVLLQWYAPQIAALRLDVDLSLPRSSALLVTQDIDVPVVLAIGLQPDGSLRCGCAADATIDAALERAKGELAVALAGRPLSGAKRDGLRDPSRRFEPDDHLHWYSGERGRAVFEDLTRAVEVDLATLRKRWPRPPSTLAAIVAALSARSMDAWIVDRSLPEVFGREWHVVRALVPGTVELSWGLPYRRLASPRVQQRLAAGTTLSSTPHPLA